MPLYASAADFPAPPTEAVLGRANTLVRAATVLARYTADDDGLPVDEKLRAALREAAVLQVQFWAETGVNPVTAGTEEFVVTGKSFAGRTLSGAPAAGRADVGARLCVEAWSVLRDAGLTDGCV